MLVSPNYEAISLSYNDIKIKKIWENKNETLIEDKDASVIIFTQSLILCFVPTYSYIVSHRRYYMK